MCVVDSLSPAEWAKQLGTPEGEIGLAVMERVYESNAKSSIKAVAMLGFNPGSHVLEIGFGNGRMVPEVLKQAENIRYAGLDRSPTMVEEAKRFNALLVAAGRANFYLGSAERMAFPDDSFDCVFSIGVAHFWSTPSDALLEIRRVLRPGGLSMMGCLHASGAPLFARPENGFHLRNTAEWAALYRAAGFVSVRIEEMEKQQNNVGDISESPSILKMEARA